jgi:hypothetical protein
MSIDTVSTMPLDIGEVLGDTFAVIRRTFVVLANLAVLFVAIPAAINIAGVALASVSPAFGLLALVGQLATVVGLLLAYAAIFRVAMLDLHGQPVATDGLIRTAAGRFWPLLGLVLLFGLGVVAGCVLLIIPGVIAAMVWSVAMPALVLEDRGVFAAFGRSAALTRGKRWSIFLLFFIVWLVSFIAELVLVILFGGFQAFVARQTSLAGTVVLQLLGVIVVPFWGVMMTALFNRLRGNAGYGAEAVAEVFA